MASSEFRVLVFGHRRPEALHFVLEGLKRQGALAATQVWLDGHQEYRDLVPLVEACRKLEDSYPQAQWFKYGSRWGLSKLFMDAVRCNLDTCRHIIFLEDDCYPAPGAIAALLSTLDEVEHDPELFSAYGHYFGTADEGERTTAFQCWGWGSPSAKLRPVVQEFRRLWMMPEPEAVAWFKRNLTEEIRARMDVFPGRAESQLLDRRFCFDATLAFLAARRGMMNKKTARHVIHNFGMGQNSAHFPGEWDWFLRPPFNMTTRRQLIDRFELHAIARDDQDHDPASQGVPQSERSPGLHLSETADLLTRAQQLQKVCDERLAEIGALKTACDERLSLIDALQRACAERDARIDLLGRLSEDQQAGLSALQASSERLSALAEERLAEVRGLKVVCDERLSLIDALQRACAERDARIDLLGRLSEDQQVGLSALQASSEKLAALAEERLAEVQGLRVVCEERLAEIRSLKEVCDERLSLIEDLSWALGEAGKPATRAGVGGPVDQGWSGRLPARRRFRAGPGRGFRLGDVSPVAALKAVKRLLRPNLNRFEQYRPRRLVPPEDYRIDRDPERLPMIAIVTPTLNQNRFIGQTIASVLQQGYPRLSYAVQDGGSTDGTIATLEACGDALVWASEADGGQAEAINRGFARIEGDIMAWLNSDDMLLAGAFAYVADYFLRHPEADMVYGNRIFIDAAGLEVGRCVLPGHDPAALKLIDYVPQETMFWRRRVWDAVGPLDGSFHYALDWDFLLRAQEAGFEIRHLARFLGCFRVHAAQKTTANRDVGKAEMQQIRWRHLGRAPTDQEISLGIRPFLLRHVAVDRLYRLRSMLWRRPGST